MFVCVATNHPEPERCTADGPFPGPISSTDSTVNEPLIETGLTGVCSGGDRMSLVTTAIEWTNDLQPAAMYMGSN